jgi:hypothetical protein
LRGHDNSCGVSGHCRSVVRVVAATQRAWYTWWCRRSQRPRLHWKRLVDRLRQFPLPRPRIVGRIWGIEPRATSTEEPDGGNLLVRIWRGAGTGNRPAYSTTAFEERNQLGGNALPTALAAPPARRGRAARQHSVARRDFGWGETCVSGTGRVAPQGTRFQTGLSRLRVVRHPSAS